MTVVPALPVLPRLASCAASAPAGDRDGSPGDERGPVVGEHEVGTPCGVVDAGERGPCPRHPADVLLGERDAQLRNELGDCADAGEDGSEHEQLTEHDERVRRETR